MRVEKRAKRASAERNRRYRALIDPDRCPWTEYATVEELFESLGVSSLK